MKKILMLVVACAVALPLVADNHEAPKPKKYDRLEWYTIVDVQYKAGKMEEALKIVEEHFAPAGRAAGLPGPMAFVNHTGPWDVTWVWYMEDGVAGMDWETTEDNIKWMQALAEQSGGMEKAQEILGSYMSLVQDFDRRIMRKIIGPDRPKDGE